MKYEDWTKEQLITEINRLGRLNDELLKEKTQETKLDYAWTGNLGQWYWDVQTNTVTFNPLKVNALGYDMTEIPSPTTFQFFTEKLHPDDFEVAMNAMRAHLYGKKPVYEVEYRIQAKDGSYRWFYDRGTITQRTPEGKPLLLVGIVFDITPSKEMQQNLELANKTLTSLSTTDNLTQISNRHHLIDQLKNLIYQSQMNKNPLTIALFDIDNFKMVNDTKGHVVGDEVLRDVATILSQSVRGNDIIGRYGGEEFMIILPHTDLEVAYQVCERIRQKIEKHPFSHELAITISGGIGLFEGEDYIDFIAKVDKKLYEAKKTGKNKNMM